MIELTSIEFRILKLFMEEPGKVFTKQQIYEQAWGDEYMMSDNSVMVGISKLRAKLEHDGQDYIKTIRGLGYRLEKCVAGRQEERKRTAGEDTRSDGKQQ